MKCSACGKKINENEQYHLSWKGTVFWSCKNLDCLRTVFSNVQYYIEDYYRKKLIKIKDIITE
jgi:hypothetical protein